MKKINNTSIYAFTVLELAIVTTVIGLIIGGMILAADLLHVARVQRTLSHIDTINKAVGLFNERYHAFPGDMPNAESFWGSDSACPNTAYTDNAHKETCNGNGNTHIYDVSTLGTANAYEMFRAWQQLANAGMYEGSYTGVRGAESVTAVSPGSNIPEASLGNAGYALLYLTVPTTTATWWQGKYQHVILFGEPTASNYTTGPILRPKEALAVDQKIDDARPAYGMLRTHPPTTLANCATSSTPGNASYNIAYNQRACSLIFITGY